MLLGYARVSKKDGSQVVDLQLDALKKAGVKSKHIYQDCASGKREDRPNLTACLKALREGDTLVLRPKSFALFVGNLASFLYSLQQLWPDIFFKNSQQMT